MRVRSCMAVTLTALVFVAGALRPVCAQDASGNDAYAGKTPQKKTLEVGGSVFTKKVKDVDAAYGAGLFANYKLPYQLLMQWGLGTTYATAGMDYTRYDEDWSSYSFWFGLRMLTALSNAGILNNSTLNAKLAWIFDWGLGFGYSYFPSMEYNYVSPCGTQTYTHKIDADGKTYMHFNLGPAVYHANTDIFLSAKYGGSYYFDELNKKSSYEHKLMFSLAWMLW